MSLMPVSGTFSLQKSISIISVLLAFVVIGTLTYISYEDKSNEVLESVVQDLNSDSYNTAIDINLVLDKNRADLQYFMVSDLVNNFYSDEGYENNRVRKQNVDSRAYEISREVELYIQKSRKTAAALVSDMDFRRIAIQNVGIEGYSALYQTENFVLGPHPQQAIEGTSIHDLQDYAPEVYALAIEGRNVKFVSGYYDWLEGGEFKRKYQANYNSQVKTADGKTFSIVATDYLPEYDTSGFLQNYEAAIKAYLQEDNYYDILFFDNHDIVYSYMLENSFTDLFWKSTYEEIISEALQEGKAFEETIIYGPNKIYDKSGMKYFYIILSPHYESGELYGFVGFTVSMEPIDELINDYSNPNSEDVEVDLLNNENLIISSNSLPQTTYLLQSHKTQNAESCGEDGKQYYVYDYINEHKEIGSHQQLLQTDWCVIVQYNYDKTIGEAVKDFQKSYLIIFVTLIILAGIISYYLGKYYVQNVKFCRKKFKKFKKVHKTLSSILSGINKIRLTKRSVFYSVIVYLFIILSLYFSFGYDSRLVELSIIYFLLYFPNILIFLYSFHLASRIKKFLLPASLLYAVYSIIKIYSDYYSFVTNNEGCILCSAFTVLAFAALALYLLASGEVVKNAA